MGLFDLFRKKETKQDNNSKWEEFCNIKDSFKDDENYKPLYYLKIYGINEINNNSNVKESAKRDFVKATLNTSKCDNEPIIKCIVDYYISREEIFDNERLISILNDLDVDKLDKIANTHTFFSYIQTRERLKTLNNNNLKDIINPLINTLSNSINLYNIYVLKYTSDLKKYFYNIYEKLNDSIISKIKYEKYKFNNHTNNIYFYDNGIVVAFNEDINNPIFVFNKYKLLDNIYKLKRLLLINDELFSKKCLDLISENQIPSYLESEFYSIKPYYIYNHNKYGQIDFYYNTDGIELKNYLLNDNLFQTIQVYNYDYDTVERRLLYIHTLEQIIERKDEILDLIYKNTFDKCIEWNELDEYGNQISLEYIKSVLKFNISITSELNNNSKEEIKFIISGSSDDLLGGHSIDATAEDGKIDCLFQ